MFASQEYSLASAVCIHAPPEVVWEQITNVDIVALAHPPLLNWLGVPKPQRAEVVSEGVGGRRIAYFDNGKRFFQEILAWEPPAHYAFTFEPEAGFRVGYFFDLAGGVFQMKRGAYQLAWRGAATE